VTWFEQWSLVVSIAALMLNFALFWLIHRDVAGSAEATRLDHDRRKKQATLEWAATAFDRQWTKPGHLPEFNDLERFREFANQPTEQDHEPNRIIAEWLDLMEDLATGVNMDVYNLAVVD
jgi:hypothetical protein